MATVTSKPKLVDQLSWYRNHSVWDRFPVEERERMLRDDLTAGTSVSIVLTALIVAGLTLAAGTLAAVLIMQ
ncbi:MAG: hypothetical protein DWQ37_17790 [Planctomycetota bacterium]|nr:MAG: hypothetical protein DWQ37_17790 [Planctomycetota bacterium]